MEPDGSMKVFRKEIHTEQYLNFSSNHLLEHTSWVVRTLMNRADRLVSGETELKKEREHIRKALQINGYPDWMLGDSWLADQQNPGVEENEEGKEEVVEESASYH